MIGLGVGIDYALFQVVRVRRSLRDGVPLREAVVRSGASSGHAVVFAGGTVAVALGGLALAGIGFVTALGWTSALVVLVSVAAAVTAVPALVALLGHGLASNVGSPTGGVFDRLVGARVVARPRTALAAGLALVLALGTPVLALQLGQTDGGDAPRSTQTRQYTDIVAAGFGPGANGPLTVVAVPGTPDAAVADLARRIRETPGVASVSPPRPAGEGATVLTVTPQTAPGDPATAELVQRLRADGGAGVHVGGATAVRVDLGARIAERLPAVLAAVIVALKAVAMNVISIGAGYGAVVLVVQEGLAADVIGLDGPVPVDAYVPLMLFVVLFGLSMDYEVFLLTAIREHWTSPAGGRDAVRRGPTDTAGVVTTAAAVILAVVASFQHRRRVGRRGRLHPLIEPAHTTTTVPGARAPRPGGPERARAAAHLPIPPVVEGAGLGLHRYSTCSNATVAARTSRSASVTATATRSRCRADSGASQLAGAGPRNAPPAHASAAAPPASRPRAAGAGPRGPA
jgi:RND superfamily putative drug exporter